MADYEWDCPRCGTHLELRKRVTVTQRRCPECGYPITPEEIDAQGRAAFARREAEWAKLREEWAKAEEEWARREAEEANIWAERAKARQERTPAETPVEEAEEARAAQERARARVAEQRAKAEEIKRRNAAEAEDLGGRLTTGPFGGAIPMPPRPGPEIRVKIRVKYTCPGCGMNVWGEPGLHFVCGTCEARLDGAGDAEGEETRPTDGTE